MFIAGLELVEEEGLFLGEVGVGGFELGELDDGEAVLNEVGTVTGEGFMGLVESLLGF